MPMLVHEELDPVFETMTLLLNDTESTDTRQKIYDELDKLGIDGQTFYKKHMKPWEKYNQVFKQHYKSTEQDDFFLGAEDFEYYVTLCLLFLQNRSLLKDQARDKAEFIRLLFDACNHIWETDFPIEEPFTDARLVEFLSRFSLSESAKWRLLLICRNPQPYFSDFARMINNNLQAFEKAKREIAVPLQKLIARFGSSPECFRERYCVKELGDFTDAYPVMAQPFSQMLADKTCYCGLLWDAMREEACGQINERERLVARLKAMADNSKLDILLLLKERPYYNLELATHLKLSPATVSHHMDSLLTGGLVTVERRDKRIYYHLVTEEFCWARDKLAQLFELDKS